MESRALGPAFLTRMALCCCGRGDGTDSGSAEPILNAVRCRPDVGFIGVHLQVVRAGGLGDFGAISVHTPTFTVLYAQMQLLHQNWECYMLGHIISMVWYSDYGHKHMCLLNMNSPTPYPPPLLPQPELL